MSGHAPRQACKCAPPLTDLLSAAWTSWSCLKLPHVPHTAHAYGRHAFGDQYRATDLLIKEPGKLELVFTPSGGGSPERHEVHEFDGAGVALGMCAWPLCSWSCSFRIEPNGTSVALGVCASSLVSPSPLHKHVSFPLAHMPARALDGVWDEQLCCKPNLPTV